jgi:hypothetical protein
MDGRKETIHNFSPTTNQATEFSEKAFIDETFHIRSIDAYETHIVGLDYLQDARRWTEHPAG